MLPINRRCAQRAAAPGWGECKGKPVCLLGCKVLVATPAWGACGGVGAGSAPSVLWAVGAGCALSSSPGPAAPHSRGSACSQRTGVTQGGGNSHVGMLSVPLYRSKRFWRG